ncbi:MAG: 50S ribosomal protein L17 [Planctomycetota bacterium]|nr:50S ribosomal protein L17 [Planctomycetota bacterium]
MRNRINGKQLSRTTAHRRAMLRNLAAGLFEHGQIETTKPKAKAVQPYVEKIITLAKRGTLHARRQIESTLTDRMIHSWVADPNVRDSAKQNSYFDLPDADEIKFTRYGDVKKSPRLVQHVLTKVAPRYTDRDGGYTRIVSTGRHRLGDGADLVLLQLVGEESGPEIGGGTSGRRRQADKRTAFAKKLGGDRGGDTTAVAEPEEAVVDEAPVEEAVVEDTAETEETPVAETEEASTEAADSDDSEEEKKD